MKNEKDDLKKAGEKNSNHSLRDQIGKRIELSVQRVKNPEYYGNLHSLDDLGIVIEWEDEKTRLYRFFQWKDIKQIWWNRDK